MNKTFLKIVALAFAIFVSFEVCYRLTIVYLFDGKSASVAFLSIILVVITHLLAKVIKKNNLAGTIDKVIFYIGCVGLYIPMIFLMFIGRKSLWSGDNQEKETLIRNFNNGVGITEMADQFRRSEPAVMQQIEKMDLYHRKDNPKRRRNGEKCRCLCDRCQLDSASCPRYTACREEQEGA